jgi:hypothetical protein
MTKIKWSFDYAKSSKLQSSKEPALSAEKEEWGKGLSSFQTRILLPAT